MSIAYEQKAATGLQELGLSTAYAQHRQRQPERRGQ